MLLDVVLRLLLEVPEFAHAILPCLMGPGLPAWPTLLAPNPLPGHRCGNRLSVSLDGGEVSLVTPGQS